MRQASWEELFKAEEGRPPKDPPWARVSVITWEELVTLVIATVAMLTVVQSIASAKWVPNMPSMFPVAFLGLGAGLVLSRVRIPGIVAHLLGLAIGLIGVFLTMSGQVGPGTLEPTPGLSTPGLPTPSLGTPVGGTPGACGGDAATLSESALGHYQRSQDALRRGDWTTYGQEQAALEADLRCLEQVTR